MAAQALSGLSGMSGLVGGGGAVGVSITDTFTGTDGTVIAGKTTDTGNKIWSGSTGMTIVTNQAKNTAGGTQYDLVDSGFSDNFTLSIDAVGSSSFCIAFRAVDNLNMIVLGYLGTGALRLKTIVAGTVTQIAGAGFLSGINIKVVVTGSTIKCYQGGTLSFTATSTYNQTATKIGIYSENINEIGDNFSFVTN